VALAGQRSLEGDEEQLGPPFRLQVANDRAGNCTVEVGEVARVRLQTQHVARRSLHIERRVEAVVMGRELDELTARDARVGLMSVVPFDPHLAAIVDHPALGVVRVD
jgi:hypothetical protein